MNTYSEFEFPELSYRKSTQHDITEKTIELTGLQSAANQTGNITVHNNLQQTMNQTAQSEKVKVNISELFKSIKKPKGDILEKQVKKKHAQNLSLKKKTVGSLGSLNSQKMVLECHSPKESYFIGSPKGSMASAQKT